MINEMIKDSNVANDIYTYIKKILQYNIYTVTYVK